MTAVDNLRTAYRRLKRAPGVGLFVSRLDQSVRDGSVYVSRRRRDRLREEWRTATDNDSVFAFASTHFGLSQQPSEIVDFAAFARARSPQVFCEIGTLHGGTHLFLTHAVPSIAVDVSVDLLIQNKAKLQVLRKPSQRSLFVESQSATPAAVKRVAAFLAGQPIDLLFIDGDHSYAGVRADFMAYRPLVRDGGLIAFHDICEDHRTRFGRDTPNHAGEVPRFWRALRDHFEHREFVGSPTQDAYGIGVIVHSPATALPSQL